MELSREHAYAVQLGPCEQAVSCLELLIRRKEQLRAHCTNCTNCCHSRSASARCSPLLIWRHHHCGHTRPWKYRDSFPWRTPWTLNDCNLSIPCSQEQEFAAPIRFVASGLAKRGAKIFYGGWNQRYPPLSLHQGVDKDLGASTFQCQVLQ